VIHHRDTDLSQPLTRRRLLTMAALGAGSVALAACGGTAAPSASAPTVTGAVATTAPAGAAPTTAGAAPTTAASGAAAAPTTASAAKPTAAGAAPAAASGKAKSIKYQQRQSGAEDFVRKKYAQEFKDKTGTDVVLEDIPDSEYFTKILALSAARQLGDLVFGFNSSGYLASWAFKGITAPLDDFVKTDKYDLKQFFDACIDACQFEGKLHALPTVGHPGEINLFYNQDMFDAAGVKQLDDSLTMDMLVEDAKKLTKAGSTGGKIDQFGYASGRSWFQLIVRLRQFGGDILSPDGKKTLLNSEGSKAALQWEYDMNYKHKAAPTPTQVEGDLDSMFLNGKSLAIYSNNVANVTLYRKPIADKFKWGVQPWPKGPSGSRGATVHVNVTHITTQSKSPQDAWEFLKLICGQDAGVQKVLMGSGSPGGRPDVWGDKRLWDFQPWYQKGLAIMGEAKAPIIAYNLRTPEIDNILIQRTAEIWLNKVTPSQGAESMAKEIQGILDQPR